MPRRLLLMFAALALVSVPLRAQVEHLDRPTVEERVATLGVSPDEGFRFVAFGDQKNLWDREDGFPAVLDQVRAEMAGGDLLDGVGGGYKALSGSAAALAA